MGTESGNLLSQIKLKTFVTYVSFTMSVCVSLIDWYLTPSLEILASVILQQDLAELVIITNWKQF